MRQHESPLAARVNVEARVLDAATGRTIRVVRAHNRVVAVGRNQVRDAVYGDGMTAPTRIALGTGTAAVADSQTTLGTEVWRDVFTTKSKGESRVEIKYFLTSTTANGNTLTEAGLFNSAAPGGDMHARVVFADGIAKTTAIAVLFVWTLTWSAD